ncbi:uncharacterized protein PGTG_13868 [Puccinia graminis f. sp. tritici CRL 75-36-700-3]|uniref:Uncharacterized protein n=1 Tax=Puccinia graminis f. sp. tritici (strain CRL 75-36-700-3 / race SCCL) TaxID=418459 RepID=E3KT72_PUCGT|nr:uncharacterized protein PGTG_13868 [Puccinia graminis f. sp. tritici CRL 75-36-700-3]EFP87497.2 hypothetical protein PGTG_13868 [Puccinia graminis f. sp. tritici CRL 75-36-700-3]
MCALFVVVSLPSDSRTLLPPSFLHCCFFLSYSRTTHPLYLHLLRCRFFLSDSRTTTSCVRIIAMSAIAQTKDDADALNLKVSGIVQLKPQGADSNYLDWSFVVLLHLKSLKLAYVLEPEPSPTLTAAAKTKSSRPASWLNDSIAVSSDVALAFAGPSGLFGWGRMHWLRQLVVARLSGDNIDSHIESMAICAERLGSLVTPEKPLTVDDIHATALLTSLTDDWLHCVSSLMNEDSVTSSRIVLALKAESLLRKARREDKSTVTVKQDPQA